MSSDLPQRVPLTTKQNVITKNSSHSQDGFVTFDVGSRYKLLETIGSGAYGVVCSAIDDKAGTHVAIKKIVNPFDVLTTAKRTLRELKLLLHFKHDNIVAIRNIIQSENNNCREVYFVMDLMETDLHHIIRSEQGLSAEHVCYFLYQVLRGLKYIHSANVIHRDLKPSNLLVNENCELKIGDFGMARGVSSHPDDQKMFMTEYVATRWYRAPELMLSVGTYSQSIDMWSVGCIFAEMMGRKQLFPGRHYVHQLQLVISVLGSPGAALVQSIRSERVRGYIQSLPHKDPAPLTSLFPKASHTMIDLLSKLLNFDPSKRPTASEALKHAFITNYHDNDDEPLCHVPFDFRFESTVTKDDVHTQVNDVIKQYHQRKNRFSKQLRIVSKTTTTTTSPSTSEEVFKMPQVPVTPKTPSKLSDKPTTSDDVDMKSATSVASMDLSLELSQRDVTKEVKPAEGSTERPIITVHVVQDEEPSESQKVAEVKSSAKPKNKEQEKRTTGKKSSQPKKSTISEDTKLKLRDSVFAKMLARQKGLGKPLEKVKKSVTAADRQREREEKRRKRQERAAEKERKKKEAEEAQKKKELSDADKSMLQRWTNMQKKTKPAESEVSVQVPSDNTPPPNDDKGIRRSMLGRHKSLPLSSTNSYRHKLQEDLATPKRWSITDNPGTIAQTSVKPDVFNVVMGNSPAVQHIFGESPPEHRFIPEPAFDQSDRAQLAPSNQGGLFIPEVTSSHDSTPQRPTSLFAQDNHPIVSVFVNNQTPGKLMTPSGKPLVSLSPDTVELVLGDAPQHHLAAESSKSSSLEGALTLSPGGTSLVFRHKANKPKKSPLLYSEPQGGFGDGRGFPQGAGETQSKSGCNGGVFVPNVDGNASLNAHHYGPLKQNGGTQASRAADATGEGYGLGVNIDDIIPQSAGAEGPLSGMDFSVGSIEGLDPCSSSLLRDWLDVRCLHPEDMEALQRELELGSPMCVDG